MSTLLPDVVSTLKGDISDFLTKFGKEVPAAMDAAEKKSASSAQKISAAMSKGFLVGGAAVTAAGATLLAASAPLEQAEASLKAAIEAQGKSVADYQGGIDKAIATQAHFGHSSADTEEALANLTMAFHDPQKALEMMHRADEAAAKQKISLAEAADKLSKLHAGATKIAKEYGVNVKDNAMLIHEADKATKAHEVAQTALAKSQQALADLEARDAGVKKLSIAQQQAHQKAVEAVANAKGQLATASIAEAKAQQAASNVSKDAEAQVWKVIDGYRGAEAQADTFSGKLEAMKTRVMDAAASVGKGLAPALVIAGPVMMGLGGTLEFLTSKTGGLAIAQGVAKVATAAWTGVQWLLNAALDANPIAVIAIAVVALAAGVIYAYTHVKAFREFVNALGNALGQIWSALMKTIGIFGQVAWWMGEHGMLGPLGLLITHFGTFKKVVSDVWDHVKPIFKGMADGMGAIGGALGSIGKVTGGAFSNLPHFDSGGIVPGAPGAPTLAVVHGGERVMTSSQQAGMGGIGSVSIHINGGQQSPREIAIAVRDELLRMGRGMPNLGLT